MLVPKIEKGIKMAGIRALVGKRVHKQFRFMGEDVTIYKLSVAQVMEIQASAKAAEGKDDEGFEVLKTILRTGVEGGSELTDSDFDGFPLEELSKLSAEVMKFSGIGQDQGK